MLKLLKSKKLLLLSFIALVSCNFTGVKPPPEYFLCSAIWKNNIDSSYGFCVSSKDSDVRQNRYRITSEQIFKEKYIMISSDDYGNVRAYVEYLKRQAEKRCR